MDKLHNFVLAPPEGRGGSDFRFPHVREVESGDVGVGPATFWNVLSPQRKTELDLSEVQQQVSHQMIAHQETFAVNASSASSIVHRMVVPQSHQSGTELQPRNK